MLNQYTYPKKFYTTGLRQVFSTKSYSRFLLTLALVLTSIVVPAQAMAAPAEQESADIVEAAIAAGSFSTLVAAVEAAGLVETLQGEGPFTVFAPTDAAFSALPAGTVEQLLEDPTGALKDILLYHVIAGEVGVVDVLNSIGTSVNMVNGKPLAISISGRQVVVGSAGFVATDIKTSNGVIHVIDSVLLPPSTSEPAPAAAPEPAPAASTLPDIVETAVGAGSFTTLVAAVQAAGLVETLQGEGPFTVFAPTDDAFAALPAGTVESLLADPSGALTDILLYHVLSDKVLAEDVVALDNTAVTTVNGDYFVVRLSDGNVKINDATVVTTDIETSNGVIHVIDSVLIPPAKATASQTPAVNKTSPPNLCGTVHHVRHGETLAGIATHYGVSMHTLAQANNIHNINLIHVGQQICIGH